MQTTPTLRTVVTAIACGVWTLAAAAQLQAHIITVADLPAGYDRPD